ncbi:MAG: enoyl-CoA hydratase-related protein [Janthinobacterium lividum]
MEYQSFSLSVDAHIAHLVLNRPEKRNPLTRSFWQEFPEAIRALDAEASARVLVISSQGPYFCSGLDVSMLGNLQTLPTGERELTHARIAMPTTRYEDIRGLQESFNALERFRMPVIAAVQGGCIGGGLDMVAACCMRYASADAFFSVFEINVGLPPDMGTIPRLKNFLPEGVMRELAYTGRRMDAQEAQQRGLVNQVFENQQAMLDGVMAIAREIATKAPLAVHASKRLISYARDHSTEDSLNYVALWIGGLISSEQIREAGKSRVERRPADFADLPRGQPGANRLG